MSPTPSVQDSITVCPDVVPATRPAVEYTRPAVEYTRPAVEYTRPAVELRIESHYNPVTRSYDLVRYVSRYIPETGLTFIETYVERGT